MNAVLSLSPQWVNLVGLIGNFVGVAIVAFEWRTSMYDSLDRIELETALESLARGGDFKAEIGIAPKAKRLIDRMSPEELEAICSDEQRFETFTKAIFVLDTMGRLPRRRRIFQVGFGAILLGTALQVLAAWPR